MSKDDVFGYYQPVGVNIYQNVCFGRNVQLDGSRHFNYVRYKLFLLLNITQGIVLVVAQLELYLYDFFRVSKK